MNPMKIHTKFRRRFRRKWTLAFSLIALLLLVIDPSVASAAEGCDSIDNPVEAAEMLSREHGITVVMTLGAEGAVAASGNQLVRLPAPAVDVVDTTGAGDTFCGYFAARVARKENPISSCLEIAIRAASIACTRPGAQAGIPHRHEVF